MNKHLLILVILMIVLTPLMATRWKSYTNTTHVNDFIEASNKLYVATWGGLAIFDKDPQLTGTDAYKLNRTYTNIDGLTNNDIRVLDYIPEKNHLWMGMYAGGINILTSDGLKILNENSGLPSNKITGISHSDSLYYVATDEGLAVFYQLANVSFPLLRQVYTNVNGLVNNNINCMTLSASNYLYMGTSQGLNYVHADSLNYPLSWHLWKTGNSNIPGNNIIQMALNTEKIAVSTSSGLGVFNLNDTPYQWHVYTTHNGLEVDSIYAVSFTETGDLYFSYGSWHENNMTVNNPTDTVLNRLGLDGTITAILDGTSGLYSKEITRIKNVNDQLLISSWGDGIFVNQATTWFNVKSNCIGFNSVTCITRSNDRMWFGSGVLGDSKSRKGTRGVSSFDGDSWQTYTVKNSPMISDNVRTIAVDDDDRIWMGSFYIYIPNPYGWDRGLNIYNPATNSWNRMDMQGLFQYNEANDTYDYVSNTSLLSNAVSYIYHDLENRMLVCCYNGGVQVMDSLFQRISSFQIPGSSTQGIVLAAESEELYFFGTANDTGLFYLNNKENLLNPENIEWQSVPSSGLNNCWVYGIVSFTNDFGENEVWIAASNGVYSYNGTNWYKYATDIKRRIFHNGAWFTDVNGLYYEKEERLFGAVNTSPTTIYLDPFRRIWIGSEDNGFSMYDPSTERFTNYSTANTPLISNFVVSLGYEPREGALYIGTPEGLSSFQIGYEQPPQGKLKKVRAYPNPFKPDLGQQITLENSSSSGTFPQGNNICRIYDLSGDLVTELKQNLFYSFTWNGLNANGKKCSTGVYFYVITTADGKTARGNIALIRD